MTFNILLPKTFSIFLIVFQSIQTIHQCSDQMLSLEEQLLKASQIDTIDETNETDSTITWTLKRWVDNQPFELTINCVESQESSSLRSRPQSSDSVGSPISTKTHAAQFSPKNENISLSLLHRPTTLNKPHFAQPNWPPEIILIDNSVLNRTYPTSELLKILKLNNTPTTEDQLYSGFGRLTSQLERLNSVSTCILRDFTRHVQQPNSLITKEFLFKIEKSLREQKYRAKIVAKKIQSWKQLWVRMYATSKIDEATIYNGCHGNLTAQSVARLNQLHITDLDEEELFILSFEFDCINYFFQRYFHELAKTIFDIQAIRKNVMDSCKITRSFFDSMSNFSISVDGKSTKIHKHSDFISDSALVVHASRNYGKRITTLGLWIEKVFRKSKFCEQNVDDICFCMFMREFSRPTIWKKPESIKEWTIRVFNTNIRFSPDAYNSSIIRSVNQNKRLNVNTNNANHSSNPLAPGAPIPEITVSRH